MKETVLKGIIQDEIYCNHTALVKHLLQWVPQLDNVIQEAEKTGCNVFNTKITHRFQEFGLEDTTYYSSREKDEFFEIYEWWQVSKWLYEKLLDSGAVVLDTDFGYFWGRSETGCALETDSTLQEALK